jgi:putative ABC transport system substrate-binding protein
MGSSLQKPGISWHRTFPKFATHRAPREGKRTGYSSIFVLYKPARMRSEGSRACREKLGAGGKFSASLGLTPTAGKLGRVPAESSRLCYRLSFEGRRAWPPPGEDGMKWVAVWLMLLAAPVWAQSGSERVFRLGHIAPSKLSLDFTRQATMPELAKLGFVEGRNLALIERHGDVAALPRLVQEVLREKPDAIVAIGPDVVRAASAATKTVPIVGFGPDVMFLGIAASQSRPGGNVTGVVILAPQLDAKRLELLKQAVPGARRIAALLRPSAAQRQDSEKAMRNFAANAGITLQVLDAERPDQYAPAFARMRGAGAEGVVITANAIFYRDGRQIVGLANEAKLPSVCEWADMVEVGCMLGYGPSRTELRRRLAHYVAQIFRGTPPGELPVETPTHFELAINLKIARTLGVAIPTDLLARADQVIE